MTNREPAGALPEVITNPVEAGGLATLGSGSTCDTRAHTGSILLPGIMLPGNGEQTAFRQLDKIPELLARTETFHRLAKEAGRAA